MTPRERADQQREVRLYRATHSVPRGVDVNCDEFTDATECDRKSHRAWSAEGRPLAWMGW